MAFVYRSTARNFLDLKPLSLGPGEYDPEISKTQGRLLHNNRLKYSKILKSPKNPPIIPFNTTSLRSQINKIDNYIPGPGTYTLYNNDNLKKNINNLNNSFSLEKDILDKISMGSPASIKKGFLSSEKRFNIDFNNSTNYENVSPGPGSYEIKSEFTKTDNKNNKKNHKKIINRHKYPEKKIVSIPDKTRGQFEIIKGILTEVKNKENGTNNINDLGPGKYNLFQKWETSGIIWDKGYKKEDKSIINENKIMKELEQNSTMFNKETYSEKMQSFNNSTISSTFKSKTNKNNLSEGWNTTSNLNYKVTSSSNNSNNNSNNQGLIRNKIFHDFFINKEKHYLESSKRNNFKNNLMLDLEYTNSPGPGFYDQNLLPRHINFSNTVQNFGSNSPKNFMIKTKNELIGPGTYFKDKNKYEKKIKNSIHLNFPSQQKIKSENSVYIENLLNKNKEKHPGPGEYNLETELIKKEISNNKSFGSKVERFHENKKNDKIKNNIDNNIKIYINQNNEEYNIKEIHRKKKIKYLKKLEKIKKKEKLKRKKYITKNIPSVGTYSPEITSSIYYNILSKMNPYRNTVAPFDMINTRFSQIKNPRIKKEETPGPADYNVLKAFNAINLDKRKYNIFGQNEQRENNARNIYVPGPGLYNINKPYLWNIKSYNVLFINK